MKGYYNKLNNQVLIESCQDLAFTGYQISPRQQQLAFPKQLVD